MLGDQLQMRVLRVELVADRVVLLVQFEDHELNITIASLMISACVFPARTAASSQSLTAAFAVCFRASNSSSCAFGLPGVEAASIRSEVVTDLLHNVVSVDEVVTICL